MLGRVDEPGRTSLIGTFAT